MTRLDPAKLWLDPIPANLRERAVEALPRGDYAGFLFKASNTHSLELVHWNSVTLQELGIYEPALLEAFIAARTNNRDSMYELKAMFNLASTEAWPAADQQGGLGACRGLHPSSAPLGAPVDSQAYFTIQQCIASRFPTIRVSNLEQL
jgi:hypothetical protein